MRKRTKVALLLAVGAAVLVGIAGILFKPTSDALRINPNAFARIEQGMTLDEVIAVVGVPPGNYRKQLLNEDDQSWGLTHEAEWGDESWVEKPRPIGTTEGKWLSDDYVIHVEFGPNGDAKAGRLYMTEWGSRRSLLGRLKAWVGW